MAHEQFIELLNIAITRKILENLNDVLEKDITHLFQNRKLINNLLTGNYIVGDPLNAGGLGSVYNFGPRHVIKQTKICEDMSSPNTYPEPNSLAYGICMVAKKDDENYKTVDTALNKKKYMIPNYIAELLASIYLSHKLKPYTDGFSFCESGLYNKTTKITYAIQERLTLPVNFGDMTPFDYLLFLFEICATLAIAQDKNKFVHYDLHKGNVMYREYETPKRRVYSGVFTDMIRNITGNSNVSITSRYQPVIIDYGFARFETDEVIIGPTYEAKPRGVSYLNHHLYNPYYDIITLVRSFMLDFRRRLSSANAEILLSLTKIILSYILNVGNHTEIDGLFISSESPRIKMTELNTREFRSIKDLCNFILTIIEGNTVGPAYGINALVIQRLSHNALRNDYVVGPLQYLPHPNISNYDLRNLFLFTNFKYIQAPYNQRIGGIAGGFAWQYQNYHVSRSALGLQNVRKRYNLTFPNLRNNPRYNDAIHVSCAVMYNPDQTSTPFRFSTECCHMDAKRFLQDKKIAEGVTMNGTFFQWKTNFGPIGFFKKNQLVIDDTDINFNYIDDYYYIIIKEDGSLQISDNNVLTNDAENNRYFDENRNTSVFVSGPKLVEQGRSAFNENKLSYVYRDGSEQNVFKYLSTDVGSTTTFADHFRDQNFLGQLRIVYSGNISPIDVDKPDTHILDISNLRPGDFIHAANPNPRSVLATTNNGLVLFLAFAGRGDMPIGGGEGSTGLDLIDLSSILANPALLAPLNLPDGTRIVEALNVDGGGSSSVNVKDSAQPYILTGSLSKINSYPVGNIITYTYKNDL